MGKRKYRTTIELDGRVQERVAHAVIIFGCKKVRRETNDLRRKDDKATREDSDDDKLRLASVCYEEGWQEQEK